MGTPNFLIAGYSGAGNIGDELLLSCLLEQVGDVHPGAGICVISFNPSVTEGLHTVPALSTRTSDVLRGLRDADAVILGPGGILHDTVIPATGRNQSGSSFYLALGREAARSGRQLALIGVGAGPLSTPTATRAAVDLGSVADPVLVRDSGSASLLGNGTVSHDLGWLVRGSEPSRASDGQRTVAVSVRSWGHEEQAKRVASAFSGALDLLFSRGAIDRALFVVMEQGDHAKDRTYSGQIVAGMEHGDKCEMVTPATIDDALVAFASATTVIAMRYHAVLLGLVSRKPTVAVVYDDKIAGLMAGVDRSGSCLDLSATADQLADAIEAAPPAMTASEIEKIRSDVRSKTTGALATIATPDAATPPSRLRFMRDRYVKAGRIRRGR